MQLIPVTEIFSRYLADTTLADLPQDTVHEGKRSFINTLGAGIRGAIDHEMTPLLKMAEVSGWTGPCNIWRSSHAVLPEQACLIHGMACHVLDFDDTHLEAMVHPSPPLVPIPFALGAERQISGAEALAAFILGIEIELRIGESVKLSGFHPTAALGNFGAAATTGILLGLKAASMEHAFSLAATQVAGLSGMNGTHAKSFHVGKACMNGYLAARLAAFGMTGKPRALEQKFINGYASQYELEPMVRDLGSEFFIHRNSYKPFACGVVAHPAIDGILRLRNQAGLKAEDVKTIECKVPRAVITAMGIAMPQDSLQAKFSTPHSVAVALLDGKAGQDEYEPSRLSDPVLRELTAKVKLIETPNLPLHQSSVEVVLNNGEQHSQWVEHAKGSLHNPLSDEELNQKFLDLTIPVLGQSHAESLLQKLWVMDKVDDLSTLHPHIANTKK